MCFLFDGQKNLTLKNPVFSNPKMYKNQAPNCLEVDPRGERTLGVLTKMAPWQQRFGGNVYEI